MLGKTSPKLVAGLVLVVFAVSFALSVPSGLGQENNITVTLTLNNTDNMGYVPGVGATPVSDLSDTTWSSPPHYYMASYLNNIIYGIVFAYGDPEYISFSKTSSSHSMSVKGGKTSSIFISFTRGDWRVIEEKIGLIGSYEFLNKISPSFGYGLGVMRIIKILIKLQDISILNEIILNPGTHEISIEYPYAVGGKPAIYINRSI